jgi:hypothetical protein
VAEAERRSIVICDAGPLIHLDELGCLDLLADFRDVLVPDADRPLFVVAKSGFNA